MVVIVLNRHFFLNYLLFLFLNLVILSARADFGSSCVPLPTITNNNYLFSSSAYGHIISNIDMTSYIENACDPSTQLSFCLKNSPQNAQICTKITMNLGDAKPLGSLNNNPDLGGSDLLKNIILSVNKLGSNTCLMMPTSRGLLPVACKKSSGTAQSSTPSIPKCSNISDICYGKDTKSQSILNFTGDAVNCLTKTLDLVFYQQNACASNPNDPNVNSVANTFLSPFPSFQASMQNAVRAALIIYVIFFGFKIVMNNEYADLNNIATFLMKFILVAYFAVGLGLVPSFNQGKLATKNGVTEFMLPFLTSATANFAQIVFKAGGSSGLCSFDISKYQAGYSGYAIWDSIDCRAGYYLGLQLLYNNGDVLKNITSNSSSSSPNNPGSNNSTGSHGINSLNLVGGMPFFSVLFGFLMGSNIIIVIAGILFAVIFISLLLQFISTYLVCLVTIYVMAYISPIFVTMALFKHTKPYFDSWLKIIVSCALQPAVLAGFIAVLLTTYDTAIFNDCEFIRHDYELGNNNFSTFELKANSNSCKDSAGYKLLRYYNGEGWIERNVILFSIKYLIDVFQLVTSLLYVGVFTFIFYFFSKSISQFASDLTGGPGVSSVTASPTKVIEQAKKFAAMAASSGGGIGGFARAGMKSAGEIGNKGKNNEGGDSGGGEAKDSIASGDAAEGGGMGGGGDGGAKDMIGK